MPDVDSGARRSIIGWERLSEALTARGQYLGG
jgi:hypothetical protein